MARTLHILLWLLFSLVSQNLCAQYPHFFVYDDEKGLPSNEVYSITTDSKGFVWLGCDAGLFKFDGVRYISYKCPSQQSKSVAGLTVSSTGRLYCMNFQSQIFYVENDVLQELHCPYSAILHIACDQSGKLLVNHRKGFAVYDQKKRTWTNHVVFGSVGLNKQDHATRSAQVNANNEVCFLTASGIGTYKNNRFQHTANFSTDRPTAALSADFITEWFDDMQFIFPFSGKNKIYCCKNGIIQTVKSPNLLKAMAGKMTTNVTCLPDGNLWICTYTGIIRYNPTKDQATVYYPDLAFSDCLIDREGNYWFTTLQSGIIRVPNLQYTVWNSFKSNKLTRLTSDGSHLYFASVNGDIGAFDFTSKQLNFLQNGNNSSIQTLHYSPESQCTFFYTNKNLYSIQNGKIQLTLPNAPPTKDIIKVRNHYILCSSFGTYMYHSKPTAKLTKISEHWSREAVYDSSSNALWVATNNGLQLYRWVSGTWKLKRTFFPDIQVLSIDFDLASGQVFVATFDGSLYAVQRDEGIKPAGNFPQDAQAYRIQYHNNKLYLATNQGVLIFNPKTEQRTALTTHSGLASNTILDLIIVDETLWLATGKGLQRIPLSSFHSSRKAVVYLKDLTFDPDNIELGYGDILVLYPETNAYSSNGTFEYAYRINGGRPWTRLPGSIELIQLQNIPTGDFEIELKVIDHLGEDSENTILLKGHVSPPFWYSWWFILIEIFLCFGIVFYVFKRQLNKRQREFQYRQEMNTLQLTAIKSQMNPHFIFNVLSSIKGYIYENDRKKATTYLDDFSDLMRTVLEMSEIHSISIADELKTLKLYIELEAMMLEQFSYEVTVDPQVDMTSINIPALVLQPYIENAFKHGLRHKQGEKKLNIVISAPDSTIVTIALSDNGIGRKVSGELNASNALKPQSFATKAIEKRIELINRQQQYRIQLETIDLYDSNGNSNGTRILLTIHHNGK